MPTNLRSFEPRGFSAVGNMGTVTLNTNAKPPVDDWPDPSLKPYKETPPVDSLPPLEPNPLPPPPPFNPHVLP